MVNFYVYDGYCLKCGIVRAAIPYQGQEFITPCPVCNQPGRRFLCIGMSRAAYDWTKLGKASNYNRTIIKDLTPRLDNSPSVTVDDYEAWRRTRVRHLSLRSSGDILEPIPETHNVTSD